MIIETVPISIQSIYRFIEIFVENRPCQHPFLITGRMEYTHYTDTLPMHVPMKFDIGNVPLLKDMIIHLFLHIPMKS